MPERIVFLPVDQAYDRWSAIYDSYRNPMVFMASRIVADHASQTKGRDVFEFGCGTGRNLAAYRDAGAATVTGCDFSPGMLAEARAKDPGFHLLEADLSSPPLPVADESADFVLFSLTLEHIAELTAPLSEARRILRPDGQIGIIEIHPFLSLTGIAAHFDDGVEEVRMSPSVR